MSGCFFFWNTVYTHIMTLLCILRWLHMHYTYYIHTYKYMSICWPEYTYMYIAFHEYTYRTMYLFHFTDKIKVHYITWFKSLAIFNPAEFSKIKLLHIISRDRMVQWAIHCFPVLFIWKNDQYRHFPGLKKGLQRFSGTLQSLKYNIINNTI